MAILSALPPELFLTICCFLDPASLDALALASKYYRSLINDEVAWRSAFEQNFRLFSSFSSVASCWRIEYTLRAALLRKYQRGRGTNVLFDAKIGNISHVCYDSQSSRIISGNMRNGLGSIADSNTGKVGKDIFFPASTRLTTRDVSAMCVFKQGIAYGFQNGIIALNLLAKNGLSSSFRTFTGWHLGPVSAVCASERKLTGQNVTLISGGMEGQVILWDHGDAAGRRLAEIKISEAPVVAINWDEIRSRVVVLAADGLHLLIIEDLSNIHSRRLAQWTSSTSQSRLQMVCDHRASSVIIIREARLFRYQFEDDVIVVEIEHGLPGALNQLFIDPIEQDLEKKRPGSGGRLFSVADDRSVGTIVVFDARAEIPTPVCRIQVDNGPITALAQNSVVVASGCVDGSAVLNNILTGGFLHSVSSRVAKFERIAAEDPARTTVGCISLHDHHPAGVIAIGGQLKAFNYDPNGDRANGKRKGLARKRQNNSSDVQIVQQGKTLVQNHIRDEMMQLSEKKRADEKEQARLKKLGGDLDLDDSEMLAYVTLLAEDETRRGKKRIDDPIANDDEELTEAIRRSLAEVPKRSDIDDPPEGVLENEDYELGIALSRSLAMDAQD